MLKFNWRYGCIVLLAVLLLACKGKVEEKRFTLISEKQSNIDFNNKIWETEEMHYFSFPYLYIGAGVGVGDFNNDGLEDIFFSGNLVPSKLYLNKGGFIFEDITEVAGITGDSWDNGVSIVDINQDGWLDIYVSVGGFTSENKRKNKLYVNNGDATFTEQAADYGIADSGFSTQAAFLDYDKDGDLDLYLLTHAKENTDQVEKLYTLKDGSGPSTDKLYRNEGIGPDGHPVFKNVSASAGILTEGYGLGVAVADINKDGWPDIYVANDFLASDLLYINNQDGTFSDQLSSYFSHTARNSMGIEMADFTNNGLLDIFVLDMLPESNERQKTMTANMNPQHFKETIKKGFQPQFIRNVLQLNRGEGTDGKPIYSEVGRLAGLHETDWSWAPLAADFDNDGSKDLYITNGFRRNITDHDFQDYSSQQHIFQKGTGKMREAKVVKRILDLDSIYLPNYMFKNEGELKFENKVKDWGFDKASLSNGAAYADFDNDGDLDLVVNNINAPAFLYRNNSNNNHYLQLDVIGKENNKNAYGAQVGLHFKDGTVAYQEKNPVKGYMSSSQQKLHFGLSKNKELQKVSITWPDGISGEFSPERLDTIYRIDSSTIELVNAKEKNMGSTLLTSFMLNHTHVENRGNDFIHEPLLLHQFDYNGPSTAVADCNGDGLDDIFIGGSRDNSGQLLFQQNDGTFIAKPLAEQPIYEDGGALFFDADTDGDMDLYIVSGGSAVKYFDKGHYQDRLYLNDGKGNFKYNPDALPPILASGSCAVATDFDRDGDLDLFVGGRVTPGSFPIAPKSYLLRNDAGTFTDVTLQWAPELSEIGMVTSAIFSDVDNDAEMDLLVVGEFMSITFFKKKDGKLIKTAISPSIDSAKGWWNSIVGGDFDNDGDTDYVVGNLGNNHAYKVTKEKPLRIYANDFDSNGSVDAIATRFIRDKEVSIAPRNLLATQLNSVKGVFRSYKEFAESSIQDLLRVLDTTSMQILEANEFASMYLENTGDGKLEPIQLPLVAQFSTVQGMQVADVNFDGNLDLLAVGNLYHTEVISGYIDGGNGLVLLGDGKGGFRELPYRESGFYVPGDTKSLVQYQNSDQQPRFVVTVNNGGTKGFKYQNAKIDSIISWPKGTTTAVLELQNGKIRKVERYWGSGYLSQPAQYILKSDAIHTVEFK